MICGPNHSYSAQEDLKTQGVSRVLFVKPLVTSKAKQESRRRNLYPVSFETSFKVGDFTPVKTINRTLVLFKRTINK